MKWKELDINYCFSWDNNSWIRTWSNIKGGVWNTVEITKRKKNDNGILMKQRYGNIEEWERHFNYLLPFFKDRRYIKKNGKPLFIVYDITLFPSIDLMVDCWNKLAIDNGLPGIYFISTDVQPREKSKINSFLKFEPNYTRRKLEKKFSWIITSYERIRNLTHLKLPYILHYNLLWRNILKNTSQDDNIFDGAFVDFDTTPRKGLSGFVTYGASPRKFYKYLVELLMNTESDFVFLNAWNEWGEGAYLEPDQKYKFKYLNSIKKAIEKVK